MFGKSAVYSSPHDNFGQLSRSQYLNAQYLNAQWVVSSLYCLLVDSFWLQPEVWFHSTSPHVWHLSLSQKVDSIQKVPQAQILIEFLPVLLDITLLSPLRSASQPLDLLCCWVFCFSHRGSGYSLHLLFTYSLMLSL